MYRPQNGKQHIQLFGGTGCILYSNVFRQPHQPSSVLELPHHNNAKELLEMSDDDAENQLIISKNKSFMVDDELERNADSSSTSSGISTLPDDSKEEETNHPGDNYSAHADLINNSNRNSICHGHTMSWLSSTENELGLRPPFDVKLKLSEMKLLIELSNQDFDEDSLEGAKHRAKIFKSFRSGILSYAIKFLSEVSPSMDANSKVELTSNIPFMSLPITLFCSKNMQIIPWEILVQDSIGENGLNKKNDVTITRHLNFVSLCTSVFSPGYMTVSSKKKKLNNVKQSIGNDKKKNDIFPYRGILGPSWNQLPLFVVCQTVSKNENSESRRIGSPLEIITNLFHSFEATETFNKNHSVIFDKRFPISSILASSNSMENDNEYSFLFVANLRTVDDSSVKNNSKKLFDIIDEQLLRLINSKIKFSNKADIYNNKMNINNFITPKENNDQTNLNLFFPVIFLSFTDLIEVSDSIAFLTANKKDSVCVFLHHILL
jgi:hypothetical protein